MTSAISFSDANAGFQAGIIHGPVSNTFHFPGSQPNHYYHQARPETPPSPSCIIPFRRDPDFVDRGTLLNWTSEKCSAPASRVALVGLGGVGKSQLAIEHCYRTIDRSPETWVFWVHASNAARLEQSFRDIADQVKLVGRSDPQVNLFKLVCSWLRDKKHGRWLLVLDNADNAAVLAPPSSDGQQHLSKYLPPVDHGSVLVTSRTKHAALRLVEESDILHIEPMHDIGAQTLLQKKLGDEVDKDDIAQLAAALEYMPLALVQAAAYIRKRTPTYSVRQYLNELYKSDKRKTSLLNQEAGHLRRDEEAKNSIITTWQISFEHIQRTRRSATNLLSLMSFFDRQGIPKELLRSQSITRTAYGDVESEDGKESDDNDDEEEEDSISSEVSITDCFEEDVLTLRDYSFVSETKGADILEMHSLVQLATQKWLKSINKIERWKQQFISTLCTAFPIGQYKNWGECQRLFPHAKAALAKCPQGEESRKEWALLLYNAAWYAWKRGSGVEAEEMAIASLEVRRKMLGVDSGTTLDSMEMMGLVKDLRGQWKDAEELFMRVIETHKMKLGADHLDTLRNRSNLASTYGNQGRWKDAEELEVQVMEAYKMKLGVHHPDTISSMVNLASTYRNQGRWKEAEDLFVQVIEVNDIKFEAHHPNILGIMSNLALTYWNQGRWKDAEELFVQVIERSKTRLGEDNPGTLSSLANLAATYWKQGRWRDSEKLLIQVIETIKTILKADHPYTLTIMANLASTYRKQGRWSEAEELFIQVIETSKMKLGADHPNTLATMANLASTYRNQGRWKDAEELEVQVTETHKMKFGADHPGTLAIMANLASTYRNQGRWKEAEDLFVQVIETCKMKLGADHPNTLTSIADLASTYRNQGRWKEAEELLVQVMETSKTKLGADHPDTLTIMANMAFTVKDRGFIDRAIFLMEDCCRRQVAVFGPQHPHTKSSCGALTSWRLEALQISRQNDSNPD